MSIILIPILKINSYDESARALISCWLIPGSSNVMSMMSHRRPSGAKLHSLAVEAPMTKVINIILAAQENSPLYIAQALDKVSFGVSSSRQVEDKS